MDAARVVIVDPYSSGALLAEALQNAQARVLAVESTPSMAPAMKSKFAPDACDDCLHYDGAFAPLCSRVAAWQPTHVLAGFESGVELADALCHALALPGNDPTRAAHRRDKFLMGEIVRRGGLRVARQYRGDNLSALATWVRNEASWPVVLKPPKSAASDQVHLCHNPTEVASAFRSILHHTNVLGQRNTAVLAQEYLPGPEYIVDLVFYEGQPVVTAYWQYEQSANFNTHGDNTLGYDGMRLLPYRGAIQQALAEYAVHAARALGIRVGPAHCELKWVQGSPRLVEIGARLSAGINCTLSRVCGGIAQLDKTVQMILQPRQFLETCRTEPVLGSQGMNLFLRCPRPGRLLRTRGLDEIRRLPTVHSLSVRETPGVYLQGVVGRVTLIGPDRASIDQDMHTIRQWEQRGIFEVTPDETPPR